MKRYLFLHQLILSLDLAIALSQHRVSSPIDSWQKSTRVILYHKPPNVVSTHAETDVLGRNNVFQDLLMGAQKSGPQLPVDFPSQWHAVGRLDADTTGLLLLTNDGGLVHHVTNKHAVTATSAPAIEKTYHALIMGYHNNDCDMLRKLRDEGVDIGTKYGGQTLPVHRVSVLDNPTAKSTMVSITILEGKNRQIRRMFHCLGSGVMKLTRTSLGCGQQLTLETVPNEGDWRILTDEQVQSTLHWMPNILEESQRQRRSPPGRDKTDVARRIKKR